MSSPVCKNFIVRLSSLTLITLLSAVCLLPAAFGQSATATLSGSVVDQNGAAIPGVAITVLNAGTSLQREVTSNEQGGFVVPLLSPGTYQVRARRDGFAQLEIPNVVLNIGDQKALNIQLKAGDVNATVTVDSNAETVRTDGSVGMVVTRQQIANMPLNGRSLQPLIQLTPGVVLTGNYGNATSSSGAQFSVNGQRTTSNYFTVDGVSANVGILTPHLGRIPGQSGSGQTAGATALGGTNNMISLDALQEFRVETSTFAPEFGRTTGGHISLVSKSGTNQFHGSFSEYFRHESLDANDWFANANRQPKPKERQNFFGGVLGGPIKKDRLFFFGSYEGLRLEQPRAQVVTVPSLALRSQVSASLLPFFKAYPLPNGKDFGDGTAQFAGSYSDPGRFNIFSLKVDYRANDSLTGFFRYNHAPSETKSRVDSLSGVEFTNVKDDSFTGGLLWTRGSTLNADLRANWTRVATLQSLDLTTFGGAVVPNVPDVFLPGRNPLNSYFDFLGPGSSWVWGSEGTQGVRQLNFAGKLGWLTGAHNFLVGADYLRLLSLLGGAGHLSEDISFTATGARSQTAVFESISNSDLVPREPIFQSLSLFGQDTWRVRTRLTLTYGVRFEHVPPPGEANGRLPSTVLGAGNDPPVSPTLAPNGTPLFNSRFGSFAPRFGASYQLGSSPGRETTLRGGVGVFYDLGIGEMANGFKIGFPFFARSVVCCNLPFPLSSAVRTPPIPGIDRPSSLWVADPNIRLPYTLQWNATWEQGIGRGQNLTVAYVGAAGRRLLSLQQYSLRLPQWPSSNVSVNVQRNLSRSKYSALQMQYRRRLTHGLEALASYTLARSEDNLSSNDRTGVPATVTELLAREWGPSDFDVRHIFSAAASYEIPSFTNTAIVQGLTKDWGLDLFVRFQSAFPATPCVGNVLLPNGTTICQRADLVLGQPIYINDSTVPGGRRFNRAAFAKPAIANQQGSFPRNGLRGLPASQVDLALRREFKLTESMRLQLRVELFNLFNHPNFGAPTADISSGLFGQPTQMLNRSLGGLNALYQMGGPRSGQLSVKISF